MEFLKRVLIIIKVDVVRYIRLRNFRDLWWDELKGGEGRRVE